MYVVSCDSMCHTIKCKLLLIEHKDKDLVLYVTPILREKGSVENQKKCTDNDFLVPMRFEKCPTLNTSCMSKNGVCMI